jgi:hypothetical protein
METFANTSAFNAGVKEKNTKTNKITIVKNQKLARQNFLFNMHIHFIFHKTIFKHIFHKKKSLYMLPKGKCICMLKRKFCLASF